MSDGGPDDKSFCNGNAPDTRPRSDVATNEELNPGHWWLF
jgi:hypothetical protein